MFANLSVAIGGVTSATKYRRSLDLDTGIHSTVYTTNKGSIYTTVVFCSYPDHVCVYDITSSGDLPEISIAFDNQLTDSSLFNTTCGNRHVRATGITQLGPPTGMMYNGIAQLVGDVGSSHCSNTTSGVLIIPAGSTSRKLSLVIGAGTNYDQKAGNEKSGFSFKGVDPGPYVESVTSAASQKAEKDLRQDHITDYQSHAGQFDLNLPDTTGSANLETSVILGRYTSNNTGDPYLESLLFQLGRHLFISSSRENSLPTNLAGRWSETIEAAWSADYHTDINIQMNHWGVDATGLGNLQSPLWDFMQDTWIPQGTNTAKLLYGAPGWVGHSFINIFGYTAMGDTASWANIPVEMAWMMQHVYDHFTYSQNATWLENQAYPLISGVAEFWLSQLQEDKFFNDGTLVVNPCNSPEHGPTVSCSCFKIIDTKHPLNTDLWLHTLPTTNPPTLHQYHYSHLLPSFPYIFRPNPLNFPHHCPRNSRYRPPHLHLRHSQRMETPRHLRLRRPQRYTPPPLPPLRLVPRPQHLLPPLRLHQHQHPIRNLIVPHQPRSRSRRRRKRGMGKSLAVCLLGSA